MSMVKEVSITSLYAVGNNIFINFDCGIKSSTSVAKYDNELFICGPITLNSLGIPEAHIFDLLTKITNNAIEVLKFNNPEYEKLTLASGELASINFSESSVELKVVIPKAHSPYVKVLISFLLPEIVHEIVTLYKRLTTVVSNNFIYFGPIVV